MKREVVQMDKYGRIQLPTWAIEVLLKKSGLRSKKKRLIKKVIKREFSKRLKEVIREAVNEHSKASRDETIPKVD